MKEGKPIDQRINSCMLVFGKAEHYTSFVKGWTGIEKQLQLEQAFNFLAFSALHESQKQDSDINVLEHQPLPGVPVQDG